MNVTAGERIAASIVSFLALAIAVAYVMDRIGLTIAPFVVLAVAVTVAVATFNALRPIGPDERGEEFAFAAIVAAVVAYLQWLARPALLPIGGGPDLTHHLMLVDYIERHWRLVHDPALGAVMGEMADYTPGLHLLAALAGAWTRTDGLHTIYPIVVLTVALKAGFIFGIAMRVLPRGVPRLPFAIAAVVMLFAPREYFLRSFSEHSFLAQVVAELFAVAMWWALVVWDEEPSIAATVMFAIAGVGAFFTWPVWIGPPLLVLVVMVASRAGLPVRDRFAAIVMGGGPIAIVAAVHAVGRMRALGIAGTTGFVVWPSVEMFGGWFLVLGSAGVVVAATDRRTRSIVWLVAAVALQAAALFVVATRSGADRPYLALKMAYLAIYPLAVAASLTLAAVWGWMGGTGRMGWMGRIGRMGGVARNGERSFPSSPSSPSRPSSLLPWAIVAVVAVLVVRPLIKEARPKAVVSQPMFLAGRWARTNVPPACVDYLVRDDDSAYWLHLAVLGNARQTARTRDEATFDPKQALIRWIQPEGLPFAITDDFDALPKDIRTSVDVVQRFGPAGVIKRRGSSTCTEHNRKAR